MWTITGACDQRNPCLVSCGIRFAPSSYSRKAQGAELVGSNGLLNQRTKNVVETAEWQTVYPMTLRRTASARSTTGDVVSAKCAATKSTPKDAGSSGR